MMMMMMMTLKVKVILVKKMMMVMMVLALFSCGTGKGQLTELTKLTELGVSHELAQFRSEQYADVKYQLSFDIPLNKQEPVMGDATILWSQAGQQPLVVDFRAEASQVISVWLNGAAVDYELTNEHIYIAALHTGVGRNELKIAFRALDQSLNRRDQFLYTLLVPDRARTLFPCFDQPDLKARYTLSLSIPKSWKAVANGKVAQIDSLAHPHKKMVAFCETEPLPTYLFSFVAGLLQQETFTCDEHTISIYHRETDPERIAQCSEIARQVFYALTWLEDFTQIPYPFAKYDLIVLPGFQYGGMEHTGATLYNDQRMFLNPQPTLVEELGRSSLIAHETAHMWFGDYVTMKWFDDVWTKEVFANYFAAQIVEPLYPTINHQLNFIRRYIPAAYSEDRTLGATPIQQQLHNLSNAGLVYSNIIYNKSPVMMEMLVQRMGQEAFRKGIQHYLRTYSYGNATWDELIELLSQYSVRELKYFSNVWVKEKGMPLVQASVQDGHLVVEQTDSWGRDLVWPQQLQYRLQEDDVFEDITIEIDDSSPIAKTKLNHAFSSPLILPNIDGRGYGFFQMSAHDMKVAFASMDTIADDLLKGSLLITLNENFQNNTVDVATYLHSLMNYLKSEESDLLYSMALGYLEGAVRFANSDYSWLEKEMWQQVEEAHKPQFRLQAFRTFVNLSNSREAVDKLYHIWKNQLKPGGSTLSERDYIGLSYELALHLPHLANAIVEEQLCRIANPDRADEYLFVSPAVSPHQSVRDSLFNALLLADNRSVEPWASLALSLLNHRLRQQESIAYIPTALAVLQEVQQTGDIFFPTVWLRSLLSGHTSEAARHEIDAFWQQHPHFPSMLGSKIRQQADHLYRK